MLGVRQRPLSSQADGRVGQQRPYNGIADSGRSIALSTRRSSLGYTANGLPGWLVSLLTDSNPTRLRNDLRGIE